MRVRTFALVASLVALLLVSSLYVPFITRAIASIPGIGQVYQRMIIWSGLNIAYDSGLVKEMHKSIDVPNGTLAVFASYADSVKTVVMFEIKAHNGDAISLSKDLEFYFSGGPKRVFFGPGHWSSWGGARSTSYTYGLDTVYVLIETDPLPWWWLRGICLHVQQRSGGDFHVKTSVPLTRVSVFNQQTVRVNRWYDEKGENIAEQDRDFREFNLYVDKVQFTPSTTKLTCDATAASPHRWNMITEEGATHSTHGVIFPPTRSEEVTFVLLSYMSYNGHMSLPLEKGASDVGVDNMGTNDIRVEIIDIVYGKDSTDITLAMDAGDRRITGHPSLKDDQGKNIFIKTGSQLGEGTVTYTYPELDQDRVYKLDLTLVEEIDCNISFTVRR